MVSQTPAHSNPQAASLTNPTTTAEQRSCVGTTQQYESPDVLMSQSVDAFGEERNVVTQVASISRMDPCWRSKRDPVASALKNHYETAHDAREDIRKLHESVSSLEAITGISSIQKLFS